MSIEAFLQKRQQIRHGENPSWVCFSDCDSAILLPMLLTSCGKKGQEGEKKTVQKSEDDFLDKDAKPDERKYLLAAKPFFIAVASRKYADAYTLLSSHARARMSLDQFKPAQQDSDVSAKPIVCIRQRYRGTIRLSDAIC